MFKKSKHKAKAVRIDTLIGQHTHIQGNLSFIGGLRIDGSVQGNISAGDEGHEQAVLTLSDQGSIEGEVRVPNFIVDGVVKGNIYVTGHIELAAKAKIEGNVYYHMLEMATGSQVNGQLIHIDTNQDILNLDHDVVEHTQNFQLEQKANLD